MCHPKDEPDPTPEVIFTPDSNFYFTHGRSVRGFHFVEGIRHECKIPKKTRVDMIQSCKNFNAVAEAAQNGREPGSMRRRLSAYDWELLMVVACMHNRLGFDPYPIPVVAITGERDMPAIAETQFRLSVTQHTVGNLTWRAISNPSGIEIFRRMVADGTLPFQM